MTSKKYNGLSKSALTFPQEPVFENCSCIAARLLDMPAYGYTTYSEVLGNTSTAADGVGDQGCN